MAREPKLIWAAQPGNCQIPVHKSEFWSSGAELRAMGSAVTSEVMAVRHLGEATFEFTDTTSVVISGTVSHAGFHAAYFAEGCPHTKFQYLADSFVVSGSTNEISTHGTYQLNGMCQSLPYYECETCGSEQYIWYYSNDQRWHIGSGGCGSASAELRVYDLGADLEAVPPGSWEEWDGSNFVVASSISVTTGSSYTKVDTEECMCPVDGVEVGILRGNGNDEPVTVNDGNSQRPSSRVRW